MQTRLSASAFLYDTAEPLAILLLTVALMGGSLWSSIALGTVRPTYLLGLADRGKLFWPAVLAAVVVRILWTVVFDARLAGPPDALGFPVVGFLKEPSLMGGTVLAAGVVTLVIGVRHRSYSWISSGILVTCLGTLVYGGPLNAVRAAGMLPVLWAFGYKTAAPNGGPDPKETQAIVPP